MRPPIRPESGLPVIWKPDHPVPISFERVGLSLLGAETQILLIAVPPDRCTPSTLLFADDPLATGTSLASDAPDSSPSAGRLQPFPGPGKQSGRPGGGRGATCSQHCPYLEKPLGRGQAAAASCSAGPREQMGTRTTVPVRAGLNGLYLGKNGLISR